MTLFKMTSLIASFDIGKKNFAFIVEEVDITKVNSIENIQPSKRYNKDGSPTEDFGNVLDDLYQCGKVVLVKNLDITEGCDPSAYFDRKLFINMQNALDEYSEYWDKCDAFIVEQQMSFGKNKNNTMALKLGQHCQSYFLVKYRESKQVHEFPAYHKTQILGALKSVRKTKPGRKKWAIEKALSILHLRNDESTLSQVTTKKKQDDMSDCLLMTITFTYLYFIDDKL